MKRSNSMCLLRSLAAAVLGSVSLSAQEPTAEAQLQDIPRILRAYDIKDLVKTPLMRKRAVAEQPAKQVRKDKPSSKDVSSLTKDQARLLEHFDLKADGERGVLPAPKAKPDDRQAKSLARLIREFCEPELSARDIVESVGAEGLVVRAPQAAHNWIARFLNLQRKQRESLILIEVTLYDMTLPQFDARIAPVLRANAARVAQSGGAKNSAMLRKGKATSEFLRSLDRAPINKMIAPSVLAQNAQSNIVILALDQISYVKDFEIEISKDGSGALIADPIVDTVVDGFRFAGDVAQLPNGRIGLSFEMSMAEVKRPIAKMTSKLAGLKTNVTIQLPEVVLAKLQTSFESDEKSLALFALPPRGKQRNVAIVSLRRIHPEGQDAKRALDEKPGKSWRRR